MSDVAACYFFTDGDVKKLARNWVPCWEGNSTNPYAPCCIVSDYCMEGNICMAGNGNNLAYWNKYPNLSQYYISTGCTDPSHSDSSACVTHCDNDDYAQITYKSDVGQWQCCGGDGTTGSLHCSDPINQELFPAPPPDNLTTITSLGRYYNALVTYNVQGQGNSLISLWLTNAAAYTSEVQAQYASATPSFFSTIPNSLASEILYGIPTTDLYTGPAPYPTSLVQAAKITTGGGSQITEGPVHTPVSTNNSKSSSNASVVGPAVGVPIGIILIAAIIFGIWFMRRRKRRAQEAKKNMHVASSETKQHGSPNYGGYYAPVEQEQDAGPVVEHNGYGSDRPRSELPGSPPAELDAGGHSVAHELDAGPQTR